MRPIAVAKNMPPYELLRERAFETTFPKIPDITRIDSKRVFPVHVDEIDLYNHVNNAVYPSWAMDSMDEAFLKNNEIAELQVIFKSPAVLADTVEVQMQQEGNETIHVMKDQKSDKVFAMVKIIWRAG
jgi:acyl-ACP thioesterase